MNCFSMLKKLINDRFFNQDPILPMRRAPEKNKEPVIVRVDAEKKNKKVEKFVEEEDDLFKEMQPKYVAPKRVGATVLAKQEKKVSNRFDMDFECDNSWHVEEIS